jgi:hypothetical protein
MKPHEDNLGEPTSEVRFRMWLAGLVDVGSDEVETWLLPYWKHRNFATSQHFP